MPDPFPIPAMSSLSPTFRTINAEHFQIMSLWKVGMRSISDASHEQPGNYLTGLLSCALAIERACKIIIILDDLEMKRVSGQGSGIDGNTFQKGIRHDIWKALAAVTVIAQLRAIKVSMQHRTATWQSELLDLLNSISTGKCRYYSIDTLVGMPVEDPLVKLGDIRDRLMQETGLIRAVDSRRAAAIAAAMSHGTVTLMQDLNGTWLTTERALLLGSVTPRINTAIKGHLIDTMKPLAELIRHFDYRSPDFPDTSDHYRWFNNTTKYLSGLKTWKA